MRHSHPTLFILLCAFALFGTLPSHAAEPLSWEAAPTQPSRFVAVHGRRSAVFGYSENGLEVWAYPLQLVDSFGVAFRPQPGTTAIEGQTILRRIEYTPESVTRIYVGHDFVVHEKVFVPLDAPGAIVTYEVDGVRSVDIVVRFTPVLNLMWPGGFGGQEAQWKSEVSGYLLAEPLHRYTGLIASPDIVAHDETPNAARQVGATRGLAFTIRPNKDRKAVVVLAAGVSGEDPSPVARQLLSDRAALESTAAQHYQDMLAQGLEIDTPDARVDRALAWSQIALEQAWVCNPDLGCGQVAGYGPSRKARRPQYDWFFAGDGMVTLHALLAAGRYERAREELEFILKFQDRKTGMMWHELSQSAGVLDWRQYPYMFVHVELSHDFIATMAEYYAVTGDLQFVKKHWNAVQAAYRYCQTLLDPRDGLPRIPSGKQGSNEQDPLSDELTLSAGWVAASEAYAALATATGRQSIARAALDTSKRARQAISARYWDERRTFWISGHTRSGAPVMDRDIRPITVVQQSLFSAEQHNIVLDQIAGADFQTDWGTRSKAESDPTYDPNSYAGGSVWGLGTSGVASTYWSEHRPATALPIWSALIPWSSLDSPGHLHEVLAGDFYHEEVESVPEQIWSSAAFLTASVQGLLGLHADGVTRQLEFAPHLPAVWDKVILRRVRIGDSRIDIELTQAVGEMALRITNEGAPVKLAFDPELPLGARVLTAHLGEREVPATLAQHAQDTHAHVGLDLPRGESVLRLAYSGGVAIIAPTPGPVLGERSRGMKIVGVSLKDRTYTLAIDRLAAAPTTFELRTPWKIAAVQGAQFEALTPSSYRLTIPAVDDKRAYERNNVIVTFSGND
jgi:glycogen debranching enzyme